MSSGSPQRLGILGGTFNPVHVAHLLLAQEAWYRYELARVLFVPAAQNPLKDTPQGATADQRLKMLRLALEDDIRFSVDATELRAGGVSYTIDTLRRVGQLNPGSELHLILGADAALSLPQWKDVAQFRDLCRIVVADRPGALSLRERLPEDLLALELRIEFMPLPPLDLSSSLVRERVRAGRPIRYLTPDATAEFIHEYKLYL